MKKICLILAVLATLLCISCTASCETIVKSDGDIQATFTLNTEAAYIGQPYTLSYELSGGSGEFEDVKLQALFPLGSGTAYGGFTDPINAKSGETTIIPEEGKRITIQIHGYDTSGKQFYIDLGKEIPLLPNPDLPVTIAFNKTVISAGQELTATYTVDGCSGFTGTLSWTIGEKGEYWDEYSQQLEEKTIDSASGTASITPTFGDYVYLVLQGQDDQGRFVYVESDAVEIGEYCKYGTANSPCEPGWWLDVENKRHARACFYHVEEKEDVNSHVLITPWEDCTPDEGGVCTGCGHDYDTSDEEPSYDDYDMYMMEAFFYYQEMYGASPVEVTEKDGKLTITFKDDFFTFMDEMGFPYGESVMVETDLTLEEVGGVWTVAVSEYGPGPWLQRRGLLEIGSVSESGAEITIDGVKHTLGGVGGGNLERCKYYQADSPCNIIWWVDSKNEQHCRACKNHVEDKEDPFSYVRLTEWTDCTPGEDYICTGCGYDYSPAQGPTEEDYDAYMVEIYYTLLEKNGVPPMDVTLEGDTLTIELGEQFQMMMLELGVPVTETLMVGTEYTLVQSGGEWSVEATEYGPGPWLQRMGLIGISDVQVSGGKVTAEITLDGGQAYTLTAGSVSPVILPGDADGDGEVGILDALAVLQAAVGWDVHVDLDAADVDDSGEVDILDALRILQYSVGWDVELK